MVSSRQRFRELDCSQYIVMYGRERVMRSSARAFRPADDTATATETTPLLAEQADEESCAACIKAPYSHERIATAPVVYR